MVTFLTALAVLVIAAAAGFVAVIKRKNIDKWLLPHLKYLLRARIAPETKPVHVMFCFVDHFEPMWNRPDYETECNRVERWRLEYPAHARKHTDADGIHPQHSFFYPVEEYREEHLAAIAELCGDGFGEIEVHLHHDNDTADNFRKTLANFVVMLHEKHGAFSKHPETGLLAWAFIHGNWALCNSLPDGIACGVNEELPILKELGCYCDMTLPCAPSAAQTTTINSIYYASDVPGQPKSHDVGVPVAVGLVPSGDLMIVQGPLSLNWKNRRRQIFPAIENGDIRSSYPPTSDRVDLWVDTGVSVVGKPEWVFVKVHTHGCQEADMDTLLGKPCDDMYDYLESKYNDGSNYVLHYTSAREMYNIIKAAEAGESGDPNEYRDFVLKKPSYGRRS